MVGILPNDASIIRLVESQLLEKQQEWQLERRHFFSESTMAEIPVPKKPLRLQAAELPVHHLKLRIKIP